VDTNSVSFRRGDPKGKLLKIEGGIDAYLATPAEGNAHNGIGILFAPEAMGIYPNSQLLADSFAAKGYTTLIPDVFNGDAVSINEFATIDLMSWLTKGSNGANPHTTEQVDPIIVAGIKVLKELGIRRIGGVGYCFGAKVRLAPYYKFKHSLIHDDFITSMLYGISKMELTLHLLHTQVLSRKMSWLLCLALCPSLQLKQTPSSQLP
jgi:hypothetical protein